MTYPHDDAPDPNMPTILTQEEISLARLKEAANMEDMALVEEIVERSHEADIADQLEQMSSEDRGAFVDMAPQLITADILAELEDEVLEDVLPRLDDAQIAGAIETLDSDDATAIIEELDETRRDKILAVLPARERAELEASFSFDEETAGRLMQREFVAAPGFWTVGQAIDHMRAQGDNLPDIFFNIYIIDASFKPVGFVDLSNLMRRSRDAILQDLMSDHLRTIPQNMDQEDIAYQFEKYHLISAPVIDDVGRLCGIVTVDDVIDIIQEENTEDILALAGVSEANITDTALSTVKARAPWLFINLLTAILASFVIAAFGFAISEYVALAVLMPIVASMGGNAGTQTLTVVVRALAERDLTPSNAARAVRRECVAAMFIGLIFAVTLGLITYVWFGNLILSMVTFIAMIANHICAGLAGILVPLGLKKMGADPAVSSSVFVTTATDVIGFFAFLGVAVLLLF